MTIHGDTFLRSSSPFSKLLDLATEYHAASDIHQIHARVIKSQFISEIFIQNRLIESYGKCGCLNDARKLFLKMTERNIFSWNSFLGTVMNIGLLDEGMRLFADTPNPDQCSWNSMISGFAQHGQFNLALDYFLKMHHEDFILNQYSFGSALTACSGLECFEMGIQIHGLIEKSRHSHDVYMGSCLIGFYSKCRLVDYAQKVFHEMRERNLVAWNSLITCYEQNGLAIDAIQTFGRMINNRFKPNEVTLASVVSACSSAKAFRQGLQIHSTAVKCERLQDDTILNNAFVDMYSKGGRIIEARRVFDRMPIRNAISETSMVSGYAKNAKLEDAKLMLTSMKMKDIVAWNVVIAGYSQIGQNDEVIALFCKLKRECVLPTHYTFGNLFNACANLSELQCGKQAHADLLKRGLGFGFCNYSDIFVVNSLIDMYMKCGSVCDACWVFERMEHRDIVSWNAVIVGYAQNGYAMEALDMARKMILSGEKPDAITLIGVLHACSHAGLVKEGMRYFSSMIKEHGITPSRDHYACMVDLLGRAGCLQEAKDLIETMPTEPDTVVWGSLLGACRVHHNFSLGEYVADKLMEADSNDSGHYILLSNMYAELGKWTKVKGIRNMMRQKGVTKQPGCSWIDIHGTVHVFMAKDIKHTRMEDIYFLLRLLATGMRAVHPMVDIDETMGLS